MNRSLLLLSHKSSWFLGMRILVDVSQSTSGRITYNGADITTLGESYRDVRAIYLSLSDATVIFTAEKFLHYVAALKGLEGEEAVVMVDELLDLVGLQDVKRKRNYEGFQEE